MGRLSSQPGGLNGSVPWVPDPGLVPLGDGALGALAAIGCHLGDEDVEVSEARSPSCLLAQGDLHRVGGRPEA